LRDRGVLNIPKPPPTPGPKLKQQIQEDSKERFAGFIYMQKEANMTYNDYLMEYDYWEHYSETKAYSRRPFMQSYKGILRLYQNYLCVFSDDNDIETYYVVSKRLRGELEILENYCRCFNCRSSKINPLKYVWCNYCTGCIKAGPGFAKPEYVEIAKLLKQNDTQHNKENTDDGNRHIKELRRITNESNILSNIKNIKYIEYIIGIVIIFFIAMVYFKYY
jgi:hypothetical protein